MRERTDELREVVTPEGVALPFRLASRTDRLGAFVIDFLVILVGTLLFVLAFSIGGGAVDVLASIGLIASFLFRTFYFPYQEIRHHGTTIGKRLLGLRVVSRDGGPLTAESVFARNLTRELEIFLPLTALQDPEALIPGLPGWATLVSSVWVLVMGLLPFLSPDRLRLGDLLGGTLVVRMPKAALLPDVAERGKPEADARYRFTTAQLDEYGIEELQVLEDILRDRSNTRGSRVVRAVAERIKRRIEWPAGQETDDRRFLEAFYRAQRGRLEQELLFGRARERKKERGN